MDRFHCRFKPDSELITSRETGMCLCVSVDWSAELLSERNMFRTVIEKY
jgi:hypothetical protein